MRLKEYRVSDYEVHAGINASIVGTFNPSENKLYKEMKELNKGLSPPHAKVLEKMLQKFCVKVDRRRNKLWDLPISCEAIQNSYVRAKSKEKKAAASRDLIKSDIRRVVASMSPHRPRPFFDYSVRGIAQFEKLAKRANSRRHPIVEVYEGKSAEIFESFERGGRVPSNQVIYDEYPSEPVEQSKQAKQAKYDRMMELKALANRAVELRSARRAPPQQPLISNIT